MFLYCGSVVRGPWSTLESLPSDKKNITNKFYKISYTVEIVSKTDHGPRTTDPLLVYFRTNSAQKATENRKKKGVGG